jgi:HEAT repeat protein
MRKSILILTFILLAGFVVLRNYNSSSKNPTIEDLIEQLNGGQCKFEHKYNTQKQEFEIIKKSVFVRLLGSLHRRNDQETCIVDATNFLKERNKESKTIVPALIEALKQNLDYDTCDGVIPIRSNIALALAEIGDDRAIEPLIQILKAENLSMPLDSYAFDQGAVRASVSGTKRGLSCGNIYKLGYTNTINALGSFGSKAKDALPTLIALRDSWSKEKVFPLELNITKEVIDQINEMSMLGSYKHKNKSAWIYVRLSSDEENSYWVDGFVKEEKNDIKGKKYQIGAGRFESAFSIENRKLHYRKDNCVLDMTFLKNTLTIKDNGLCASGGASFTGEYEKEV